MKLKCPENVSKLLSLANTIFSNYFKSLIQEKYKKLIIYCKIFKNKIILDIFLFIFRDETNDHPWLSDFESFDNYKVWFFLSTFIFFVHDFISKGNIKTFTFYIGV